MEHFMKRKPYAYPFYWQIRSHPEHNKEFNLYYELMKKYEDEHNRQITYIVNNSASNFLNEINNGISQLEITIISNKSESDEFRKFIINKDHYCPVISRIKSIGYDHGAIDFCNWIL